MNRYNPSIGITCRNYHRYHKKYEQIILHNYNYEVLIFVIGKRTSSGEAELKITALNTTSAAIAVAANGTSNRGLYLYVISSNRTINIEIKTNKFASTVVEATAYRRIGTNA